MLLPPSERGRRALTVTPTRTAALIERGNAYRADNGDVYFDVSTFDRYGSLSGRDPEDLRAGAR